MKKIIFFTKNLQIGGMEKSLVKLINSIDFQNYEVTLVLEKLEGKLLNHIRNDIKITNYNLSSNNNILIRKITNIIKKTKFLIKNYKKYDCAINYATYSVWGSQMALRCSKNSVLYIHSDYYEMFNGDISKIRDFFKMINVEKFKKIVFVSKQSKEKIVNIMPEISNKCILLGNMIDAYNIQKQAELYKVEFDTAKINLLVVARLDDEAKQLSKLIKTINTSTDIDKFTVYIIGSGPDENKYHKLSKTKNIIFLGEMDNPYPYIKNSDYLLLTSKYEGFPVVYNEATVLGTKIITTIPVEDEQISYSKENVIMLKKDLSNFDDIIQQILSGKVNVQVENKNFQRINEKKIQMFYEKVCR